MGSKFISTGYEAGNGSIFKIRVLPSTTALILNGVTNDAPKAPPTVNLSARVGGSRRTYGLHARHVTLRWTATPPAGYEPYQLLRVPILQPTIAAGIIDQQTGTYQGVAVAVVSSTPEKAK